MRISRNRVEWTKKEVIRNVAGSIILLFIVFLWDNRDYLFQYKLHKSQYIQVEGRAESRRRSRRSKIVVQLPEGEKSISLPRAWNDLTVLGYSIPMVYSSVRKPELCRGSLVVTIHLSTLFLVMIFWNVWQVRL